jgi:putative transposase
MVLHEGRNRRTAMPNKRFTEEQNVAALWQAEAGKKVTDVCRKIGVSLQSFYHWKAKYCGVRHHGFSWP